MAIEFHWKRDKITPALLVAVGSIVLEWAWLDQQTTNMVHLFWANTHPQKRMPRPFDKRIDLLRRFAADLYKDEPDELRTFRWYLQRLTSANGKRDSIVHGRPGMITIDDGQPFEGVMVHSTASHGGEPIPLSTSQIIGLVAEIEEIHRESHEVHGALVAAHNASSPNIRSWQVRDGLRELQTMENRIPKLPRWRPPPPTFR